MTQKHKNFLIELLFKNLKKVKPKKTKDVIKEDYQRKKTMNKKN